MAESISLSLSSSLNSSNISDISKNPAATTTTIPMDEDENGNDDDENDEQDEQPSMDMASEVNSDIPMPSNSSNPSNPSMKLLVNEKVRAHAFITLGNDPYNL